jgi:hypothetical protein
MPTRSPKVGVMLPIVEGMMAVHLMARRRALSASTSATTAQWRNVLALVNPPDRVSGYSID